MITRDGLGRVFLRCGVLLANAVLFGVAARTLNPVEMGIWSLASSMTSIVMSLDFGAANFVRNQVIVCAEREKEVFTAGVWFAFSLALTYSVCALAIYAWWPIDTLHSTGLQIAFPFVAVAVLLLSFRLPSAVGMNCFFSFNEANLYNVFEFAGTFVSVSIAFALLTLGFGIKYSLIGFYGVGTVIGWLALSYFIRRRHWVVSRVHRDALVELANGAWPFGVLQIVSLGLGNMPSFVIGSLVGIEDVTAVRATLIIGQAVLSLHLAHAMPLWTAFSKIHTTNKMSATVTHLRRRLAKEAMLLGLLFLALAAISSMLINLWIGRPVASFPLCLVFSLWAWGCGVCNLYSLVLNGRGRPLLTAAALVPGTMLMIMLADLLAVRWGSVGVGAAFASGAALSATLMVFFAVREIRGLTGAVAGL